MKATTALVHFIFQYSFYKALSEDFLFIFNADRNLVP